MGVIQVLMLWIRRESGGMDEVDDFGCPIKQRISMNWGDSLCLGGHGQDRSPHMAGILSVVVYACGRIRSGTTTQ
jgi:hypothetical protein